MFEGHVERFIKEVRPEASNEDFYEAVKEFQGQDELGVLDMILAVVDYNNSNSPDRIMGNSSSLKSGSPLLANGGSGATSDDSLALSKTSGPGGAGASATQKSTVTMNAIDAASAQATSVKGINPAVAALLKSQNTQQNLLAGMEKQSSLFPVLEAQTSISALDYPSPNLIHKES